MKNLILLLLLISLNIKAQTIDIRKFIEVTGSAELEVEPDEITIEIVLNEYYDEIEKKNISLNSVEKKFNTILKNNHIDTNSINIDQYSNNYWWYWWCCYRHNPTNKKVSLKLKKETNFLELVKALNHRWVSSITITNSSNKNITEFRKEVKKSAVKAAKEKAKYLLESVDESIGSVLSIEEIQENNNHYWYRSAGAISNTIMSNNNIDQDAIANVAKIKLRYEIKAKFEIN